MGVGKVLGYTILGAGVGIASTLVGGAALVGAATGAYTGYRKNAYEKLENQHIKCLASYQKLQEAYNKSLEILKNDKVYFTFILGMTGLGIAMANADGYISDEERYEIEEYCSGMGSSNYPQPIKDIIDDFYRNPPSLGTIIDKYISKIDPVHYETLQCLLDATMQADGEIHEREKLFKEQFTKELFSIRYSPDSTDEVSDLLETK